MTEFVRLAQLILTQRPGLGGVIQASILLAGLSAPIGFAAQPLDLS